MNTVEYVFKDIKAVCTDLVVKFDREAKDKETVETLRESDRYIAAMLKQDNFDGYASFDKEAIEQAGVVSIELIRKYHDDKFNIPVELRDRIVVSQRKYIIDNYVERNDYYRTLIGIPEVNDKEPIYLDKETCAMYRLDPSKAIHEYTTEEQYRLENKVIPDLIVKYPKKKYLKYLGTKKVDLVKARTAMNFQILRYDDSLNDIFLQTFFDTYEKCRMYFTSVIYIADFGKQYDLYDNFMGLNILFMTIQRVLVDTIKIGVNRDFYDLESIKTFFESYNVPFFSYLPLDYQRSLMKNLNQLLRYKSTDKVLYDVSSLLFFDRVQIFKYFLVKKPKLDVFKNPIFKYKEVEDEEGNVSLVEDAEKMYDFYFQSTNINERNIALALENSETQLNYVDITENDPYWWHDDELEELMYKEEFNYVETKYLSINVMYKMTQMIFETCYAFNMLIDKKDDVEHFYIGIPRITAEPTDIFTAVVLMCALLSKKARMKGNIINSPTKILTVMGFNFRENLDVIKQHIKDNPKLFDEDILYYLENLELNTPDDINNLYNKIIGFGDFCVNKISTTQDVREYHAYKQLYDTMMIRENNTEVFKLKDGTVAQTYKDYLKEYSPELALFVEQCEKDKISIYIDHIIGRINELLPQLEYMGTINDSDNSIFKALIKLIEFFKSYTTDLESYNVVYLMNSRYYNMIRMVHDINLITKTIAPTDKMFLDYFDKCTTKVEFTPKDAIDFVEKNFMSVALMIKKVLINFDDFKMSKTVMGIDNLKMSYNDKLKFFKDINVSDNIYLKDFYNYLATINVKDKINFNELLTSMVRMVVNDTSTLLQYSDHISYSKLMEIQHTQKFNDFIRYMSALYFSEIIPLKEKMGICVNRQERDNLLLIYKDMLVGVSSYVEDSMRLNIRDQHKVFLSLNKVDRMTYKEIMKDYKCNIDFSTKLIKDTSEYWNFYSKIDERFKLDLKDWYSIYRALHYVGNMKMRDVYRYICNLPLKDRLESKYVDVIEYSANIAGRSKVSLRDSLKVFIQFTIALKDNVNHKDTIQAISKDMFLSTKDIHTESRIKILKNIVIPDKMCLKESYKMLWQLNPVDNIRFTDKCSIDKCNTLYDVSASYMDRISDVSKESELSTQIKIIEYARMIPCHNLQDFMKIYDKLTTDSKYYLSENIVTIYSDYLKGISKMLYDSTRINIKELVTSSSRLLYSISNLISSYKMDLTKNMDIKDELDRYSDKLNINSRIYENILLVLDEHIISSEVNMQYKGLINLSELDMYLSKLYVSDEVKTKYNVIIKDIEKNILCDSSILLNERIKIYRE